MVAQHCGYPKGSIEDVRFRAEYKDVCKHFQVAAKGALSFNELESGLVNGKLYDPICQLVARYVNEICHSAKQAQALFAFLVGQTPFYKVMFNSNKGEIHIKEFGQLSTVTRVEAQGEGNYVQLSFSNGARIAMRLHTASSKITSNPGLKFDTHLADDQPADFLLKL